MSNANLNFRVPGSGYVPANRRLAMIKPSAEEIRMSQRERFDLALVPSVVAFGWSGLWTEVGHTRPPRMHWSLE